MSDVISRQAAMKLLRDDWQASESRGDTERAEIAKFHFIEISNLPAAQPEIVRCKDCKHWIPYDWMFSEVWQSKNIADYPEDEMGCKWCDMSMKANDFCSRAERREVTE